jgi:predicted metalloprotease
MGGMAMLGGGGSIGLLLLVLFVAFGGDLGSIIGGSSVSGPSVQTGQGTIASCETGADANERRDCRVVGFVNSVQVYWDGVFEASGLEYDQAVTNLFSGAVDSGCGYATSATGPFYCPLDQSVYLDLTFFDDLRTVLGAEGGPLAEGYVIAHEYGHHVQQELGWLGANAPAPGADGSSVRTELQADCYAGAWAAEAADTGFLEPPTREELDAALDAAASVGDDRIQQRTAGEVDPHRWTHGSSRQRQDAFILGYEDGEPAGCDALQEG